MKNIMLLLALLLALFALIVGCGPKAGPVSDGQVTAAELARLQDFHVWKIPLLQTQQPVKGIQLVMVHADRTVVLKSGTGSSTPPPSWTNILLGFRYEGGGFVGTLEMAGPNGTLSWPVSFTNAPDELPRSWVMGKTFWKGDRAELATFWSSHEAAKRQGNDYSTLAVELVK